MSEKTVALRLVSSSLEAYLSRQAMSRDGKDALARQLALLFSVTAPECGPLDLARLNRLMLSLVEDAEVDTRSFLAVQMAVASQAPTGIVRRLALDVIEVARPVLKHSPVLQDRDLVEVALEAGLGHMAAIAERAELSITVTDVLIRVGDDGVRRQVAGNHGARISSEGYRRLSVQAREDEDLERIIVARDDVPDIVVRFLVRNGQGAARGADEPGLTRGGSPARGAAVWFGVYDFAAAQGRIDALIEHGLRGEPLLMRLVAEERFPEAAILVSRLARLRLEDAVGFMTAPDAEPFLTAAKSVPLEPRTVFGLLGIGPWRNMLDGFARQAAMTAYHQLEPAVAQDQLAAWRRHRAAAPLAPLEGSVIPSRA